ncbi:endonuclease/exonuclease/phosphatase family protein [Streptomyces sporangiiformans]|uniref:Endonuclease/exonuclease/phosphatase family protein n=1 Tax=Streptomyces sporangiiformans TaxID=2315329 RepID=A0A505DR33_9ACTN|nr:endonuclease/exonuclease/phosphatase family protein [Streptomyces sporangiiformans]
MCALLSASVLLFPSAVPNSLGNLGSLIENFLPWLGLAIPILLPLGVLRRSATALLALLAAAAVWAAQYGPSLLPQGSVEHDLTVVQHNVSDENDNPSATARTIIDAGPDLIALEELTGPAVAVYKATFRSRYPHHAVMGTVGLWSRYPLVETEVMDIRPRAIQRDWSRGLRATVRIDPRRDIAVYVAHLPSVRIRPSNGFDAQWRDESAALLGDAITADKTAHVLLMGDLNGTTKDRGLSPITSQLSSSDEEFEFSWPRAFPVARIDQVMGRGTTVTEVWTLPATGSDHLPLAAHIKLPGLSDEPAVTQR